MAREKKQLWLRKLSVRWPRVTPETTRLHSKSFQIISVEVYVNCVQCTNVVDVGRQMVQLNSERLCLEVQRSEDDFNQECWAVSYKDQSISFFIYVAGPRSALVYQPRDKKISSPKQMLRKTPNSASQQSTYTWFLQLRIW
jgi:hypothetical protein